MSEYLPREVRLGLELARKEKLRQTSRLKVKVGGESFTILRYWDGGFALDSEDAPHVRGRVDVYDGARHLSECLIVASSEEGGEMVYEFKRETRAADSVPRDYAGEATRRVARIGKT